MKKKSKNNINNAGTYVSPKMVQDIVDKIRDNFPSFGGGKYRFGNPLSRALADGPAMFAAGVDIMEVVEFVIKQL